MHSATLCTLLTIVLTALMPAVGQAAPRLWKNTNATRSFQGELVKREADKVTIMMMPSRKTVVVKPDQLHADDLQWLRENHPFEHEKPAVTAPKPAAGAFYDTLAFGDDQATVIRKLKASPRFHTELDDTYFARTGLNGTFRTTKGNEFFGMPAALYYEWDNQGGLMNLSLYGHETPAAMAGEAMVPLWQEMVDQINKQFGQARSSSPKPAYAGLGESQITFTHAWPMTSGGSLLLGVGKQEGKYVIIARFTIKEH